MDSFVTQIELADEQATLALGAAVAPHLRTGDVFALRGGLGAGKTCFARGVITALVGPAEVPSPTYTLVQSYDTPQGELWHGDMYRLPREDDVIELGLEDAFLDCICLIEWPDKIAAFLPDDVIDIEFSFDGPAGPLGNQVSRHVSRQVIIKGAREWIKGLKI